LSEFFVLTSSLDKMDNVGDSMDGLSSLVRLTGVNVPARARFVGEAVVNATLSGLTAGLVCGQVGATIASCGPLVPFLVGSWLGSGFGLYGHWRKTYQHTLLCAVHYPTIFTHSLWTEQHMVVPPQSAKDGESLKAWVTSGGLGRLTWCILAAQACRGDVEEVQRKKRQQLVDEWNQ
jgi:hypothetical protein